MFGHQLWTCIALCYSVLRLCTNCLHSGTLQTVVGVWKVIYDPVLLPPTVDGRMKNAQLYVTRPQPGIVVHISPGCRYVCRGGRFVGLWFTTCMTSVGRPCECIFTSVLHHAAPAVASSGVARNLRQGVCKVCLLYTSPSPRD